jgi:hypothetical protein
MQLSDGFNIGEVGILRKGWYFTRKCDGWETSATHRNNSRMCFKGYLLPSQRHRPSGKELACLRIFPCFQSCAERCCGIWRCWLSAGDHDPRPRTTQLSGAPLTKRHGDRCLKTRGWETPVSKFILRCQACELAMRGRSLVPCIRI